MYSEATFLTARVTVNWKKTVRTYRTVRREKKHSSLFVWRRTTCQTNKQDSMLLRIARRAKKVSYIAFACTERKKETERATQSLISSRISRGYIGVVVVVVVVELPKILSLTLYFSSLSGRDLHSACVWVRTTTTVSIPSYML